MSRTISRQEQRAREQIARRVRARRAQLELPQQVAAHVAGVSRFTFARYEEAEASIPSEVLPRVAKALRTSCVKLLGVGLGAR